MRESQRRGAYVDPRDARTPFSVVAQDLLDATVDDNTRASYRNRLAAHVLPVVGDLGIASVTEAQLDRIAKELRAKGLAESTVQGCLLLALMVVRRGVRDRLRPAPLVYPLPEIDRPEVLWWTPVEMWRLLDSIAPEGRAAVALGYGFGLRQGEVLGMQEPYVEFLRRTVRVEWQIDPQHPGQLKRPKTKASRASVPGPQWAFDVVAEHVARWPVDSGPILRAPRGGHWRRDSFNESLWEPAIVTAGFWPGCAHRDRAACRRAAFANADPFLCAEHARALHGPDWRDLWPDDADCDRPGFHGTRHSYVAALINGGMHPLLVQRRARHAHLSETMETYGHLFPEVDEAATRVMETVFDEVGDATGTNGRRESRL